MNGPVMRSSIADRALAVWPLCDDLAARREHDRAPVALRVGVRERAADGAAVPDDRVCDEARRIAEQAVAAAEELGALAVAMADERADPQTGPLRRQGCRARSRR